MAVLLLSVWLTCRSLHRPLPKGQIIKVRMHNFMVGVPSGQQEIYQFILPVPVAGECFEGVCLLQHRMSSE